jgi:hypothetical protein
LRFFLYLVIILLAACQAPEQSQEAQSNWYKGNLHTHSFWSDGDDFPEMIMSWYKEHDYHFLALTDHNTLAEGERWLEISDSLKQATFNKYLDKYGQDWVQFSDSGGIRVKLKTLAEYGPLFEENGKFLVIQGEEITDSYNDKPLHLNANNLQQYIAPQGGSSVVDVLQRNINAVLQQREASGLPMMVHINHPNFHFAITVADMIALQGEQFFELFNGHHMVYNLGDSTHMDTETMWDQINIAYALNQRPLLYGLATDDSHNYHRHGAEWSNSGRGWVWVKSESLNPENLIASLERGDFYASTGVTLESLEVRDNTLRISVLEDNNSYTIQFVGCTAQDNNTRVLKEQTGYEASFELEPEYLFVRARIISSAAPDNPVEDIKNQMAWTQPVVYAAD